MGELRWIAIASDIIRDVMTCDLEATGSTAKPRLTEHDVLVLLAASAPHRLPLAQRLPVRREDGGAVGHNIVAGATPNANNEPFALDSVDGHLATVFDVVDDIPHANLHPVSVEHL